MASLPEILALRSRLAAELARPVGLKLEVKSPAHFAAIGHPMADRLITDLDAAGMLGADSPVEIMTFEPAFLRCLRARGVDNDLVLLVEEDPTRPVPGEGETTFADLTTPASLAELASLITGIGPGRHALFSGLPGGRLGDC